MLVLVPTREDVLAIRSIDEAFDLWTTKVTAREVALIRIAAAECLVDVRRHADEAADDESITLAEVMRVIRFSKPASKDVNALGSRQVGINFVGMISQQRRIRVKVSRDRRHYTVVHTI